MMKKEIRVIGIDDGPFDKFSRRKQTIVIATVFRGGSWMEGMLSTKVSIDGSDSTSRLIKLINNSKFSPQLQAILLDGIALGGFNVVDIEELSNKTGIPVIVVIRRMPDIRRIKSALRKIGSASKISIIEKAGRIHSIGSIYAQFSGITKEEAADILNVVCTRSHIPEPIRIAHIIASGLSFGESRGRA